MLSKFEISWSLFGFEIKKECLLFCKMRKLLFVNNKLFIISKMICLFFKPDLQHSCSYVISLINLLYFLEKIGPSRVLDARTSALSSITVNRSANFCPIIKSNRFLINLQEFNSNMYIKFSHKMCVKFSNVLWMVPTVVEKSLV